jgi:hypothetical protein
MRIPHYCPYCDQRSTRRWNLQVHIKRKHGGYLLGRLSDRYMGNNPPLYSRSVEFGHATVQDSVGNSFQPRYISQQIPIAGSSYPSENQVIADSTSSFRPETLFQPPLPAALPNLQTTTVQQKLGELKILAGKFSFPEDARKILEWANIRLRQGDESFLNNKLDQLRMLDMQGWLPI